MLPHLVPGKVRFKAPEEILKKLQVAIKGKLQVRSNCRTNAMEYSPNLRTVTHPRPFPQFSESDGSLACLENHAILS
jgi:hypothetical protein